MDYGDLIKRLLARSEYLFLEEDGKTMREAAEAIEKLAIQVNNYRKAIEALERSKTNV